VDRVRNALIAAVAVVPLLGRTARAEHDHGHAQHHAGDAGGGASDVVTGSLGLVAARYETMFYRGDYAGLDAGLTWSHGRFVVGANVPAYRLERNGETIYGLGDIVVHGEITAVERGALALGASLAVSFPTGADRKSLGMGHTMAMGAAWGTWRTGALALGGSAGYSRVLGGLGAHAGHGAGPIVEPMGMSELTFGASADLSVATSLALGVRATAALAVPRDDGDDRATAGVRVTLVHGRFTTSAAIDAGLVGDPYQLRGTIATAFRF
jgi:hypothetical protein